MSTNPWDMTTALADVIAGVQRGEILAARRALRPLLTPGNPEAGPAVVLAENLWSLDFGLRQRLIRELRRQLELGDSDGARQTMRRLHGLLAVRQDELSGYVELAGEHLVVPMKDPTLLGLTPEEKALRRGIDELAHDVAAALPHLRTAAGLATARRRAAGSLVQKRSLRIGEIDVALGLGRGRATNVWEGARDRLAVLENDALTRAILEASQKIEVDDVRSVLAGADVALLESAEGAVSPDAPAVSKRRAAKPASRRGAVKDSKLWLEARAPDSTGTAPARRGRASAGAGATRKPGRTKRSGRAGGAGGAGQGPPPGGGDPADGGHGPPPRGGGWTTVKRQPDIDFHEVVFAGTKHDLVVRLSTLPRT